MACITPFYIDVEDKLTGEIVPQLIPCGHCEQCLKKKQSDWISRLYVESLMSLSCFFITLTYDDAHLPFPIGVNKPDVQKFFKRFRKSLKLSLKYFLVSEYGAISSRPHYHFLLFLREKLDWIVLSNYIQDSWPLGSHKIGTVSVSAITYVTKYCLKSRKDPRKLYYNKTFALMSKRPAIGYDLLSLQSQYNASECFEIVSGTSVVALPRYYRDKFFDEQLKLENAAKMQEKYRNKPSALSAYDRYVKRVRYELKQQNL